ncbi:bifunctional metallophosphatase/5'-nucleotidase [Kribbella deserti]|uniref:Bifunctional metallophosphatase/5'-nucleotidase n=1 Tax=Kribbella deserti TaxID=1926257 RepID=A0ABV6QX44_9ACTN
MAFPARDKNRSRGRRATALVAAAAAVTLGLATGGTVTQAAPDSHKPKPTHTQVHLLSINDFHGNLVPNAPTSSSGHVNGTPAGGAEYLATHLEQLRAAARANGQESITVAAGDLIGGSPLLSAAFHDEPTIEAMNLIGLEATSVGNHEFDEGWRELLRMQKGGCLPDGDGANNQNSCPDPKQKFKGADFDFLSANVFFEKNQKTLLAPYTIKKLKDGRKIGFIGMTLENTPNIVTKSGIEGLKFTDEVETANALVPELKKKGVEAIVVLLHEGGIPADPKAYNSCPGISGPIVDIAKNLDAEIDAVITGHTHQGYNCSIADPAGAPRLVTSAFSFGRLVTDLRMSIDNLTNDVDRANTIANNLIVTQDVPKARKLTQLIDKYKALVAPIESKVIGHITTDMVSRTADASGESPLGNLIADAQLADPSTVTGGKTPVAAFMNPGGIRSDLVAVNGAVTFGAAFTVQPFNNYLVSMDLTGTQIRSLLAQQFTGVNQVSNKVLQVSGITYTWKAGATPGTKEVVADSVKIAGQPLVDTTTYRIVTNNFLSDGGDGFGAFATGTNKFFGGLDIDAFANYLTAHDPYTPGPTDRITVG